MSIDKRDGYKGMLDYMKENSVDGIVVWSLSRLGRRMKDIVEFMDYLKVNGIKFCSNLILKKFGIFNKKL